MPDAVCSGGATFGRWIEMKRPAYVSNRLAIVALDKRAEAGGLSRFDRIDNYVEILERGIAARSDGLADLASDALVAHDRAVLSPPPEPPRSAYEDRGVLSLGAW